MKKLSFLVLLLVVGLSLQAQQLVASKYVSAEKKEILNWKTTNHNFGEIVQGVPVSTTFSFINTSSTPLLITQVAGSCGCTVTTYTKEAIAPGEQGYVTTTYNAASPGAFRKAVTVTVSTMAEPIVLSLQGTVLAKKGD